MPEPTKAPEWWRDAVIYQVYLRSFADGDGDGVGDLAGIRVAPALPARRSASTRSGSARCTPRRWTTAATTSPTTATSTRSSARSPTPSALIAEAHALGIRVILDIVANHTSDQHPWFRRRWPPGRARPSGRRYIFRRRPRPGRRASRRTTGSQRVRRPGLDPRHRARRRAVVPAPVRPRAARPQLGQPGGPRRVRRRPAVLVRPRRRRLPRSTSRTASSRTRRCPTPASPRAPCSSQPRRGGPPVLGPRRRARHLPRLARDRRLLRPATAMFVAEVWVDGPDRLRPLPAPGRAAHGVQLRLPERAVGRGRPARDDRRARWPRTRAVGAPPPGCCPTTT